MKSCKPYFFKVENLLDIGSNKYFYGGKIENRLTGGYIKLTITLAWLDLLTDQQLYSALN